MPHTMPAPRLTRGHFLMAVVIVSLGYFLVWPVLLLLINSFNAANDWFVEPRRWGITHWVNAFQRPGLLRSLGNSLLIWSLTVGISFPIGVGHRLAARPHQDSMQPDLGIPILGFLHGAQLCRRPSPGSPCSTPISACSTSD